MLLRTLLLSLGLWLGLVASPAYGADAFIPLDDPLYEQVSEWVARGLLPADLEGMRPYRWGQLATLLDGLPPLQYDSDRQRLRQWQQTIARQQARLTGQLRGRASWVDGVPVRHAPVPAQAGAPLLEGDGGATYGEHAGALLQLRLEGRLTNSLTLVVAPELGLGRAQPGNRFWQQAYLLWRGRGLQLSGGVQPLVWGVGRLGGFVLTDQAAPRPTVRLNMVQAATLPGDLSRLGRFRFDLFTSRLEADRMVPHALMSGLRLEWHPFTWATWGVSRAIQFGGRGHGASLSDFATILTGRNLVTNDTSNSIGSIDLALHLPLSAGRGLTLYGEYAGEDEAGFLPTKPALRGGALLAGLGGQRRVTVRAEFVATDVVYDHKRWGHQVWYRHGVYQSGYTYRGRIMGDPAGPDGRAATLEFSHDGPQGRVALSLGWRVQRFSEPAREDHRQVGLRWQRLPVGPLWLDLLARTEQVQFDDGRRSRWQSLWITTITLPFARAAHG